jgi:hypothetical protein
VVVVVVVVVVAEEEEEEEEEETILSNTLCNTVLSSTLYNTVLSNTPLLNPPIRAPEMEFDTVPTAQTAPPAMPQKWSFRGIVSEDLH